MTPVSLGATRSTSARLRVPLIMVITCLFVALPLLTAPALAATSSTHTDGVVILHSSVPGGGVEASASVVVYDGLERAKRNHPDFVWLPIRASLDVSSDRKDAEAATSVVVEAGDHELGHTIGFRHEHTRPES